MCAAMQWLSACRVIRGVLFSENPHLGVSLYVCCILQLLVEPSWLLHTDVHCTGCVSHIGKHRLLHHGTSDYEQTCKERNAQE